MPRKEREFKDDIEEVVELSYGEEETKPKEDKPSERFHREADKWFCNVCGDIGREVDGKRKCQGCGATE